MNASEKAEFIFHRIESINADTRKIYEGLICSPWQFVFLRSSEYVISVYSSDHGAFGRLDKLCAIAAECDAFLFVSSIRYKEGLYAPCVCFSL